MNSDSVYDLAQKGQILTGSLERDYELSLRWLPFYVDDFPSTIDDVELKWEHCKFVAAARTSIPRQQGVYCFSVLLGEPFPPSIHLILYIGKAAPGFLSERFDSYLKEKNSSKARKKLSFMLNKYENQLFFWWAALPRLYVDVVEEHLLMCCQPPCNEKIPSRERLWGTFREAF